MSTIFDKVKAQREMIAGLADILRVLNARTRAAEQRMSESEAELLQYRKLEGFVKELMQEYRDKLAAAEAELRA
jgi:hypothetical protein